MLAHDRRGLSPAAQPVFVLAPRCGCGLALMTPRYNRGRCASLRSGTRLPPVPFARRDRRARRVGDKPYTTPLWLTRDAIPRAFTRHLFCIDVSSLNPAFQPCKLFFDEDMDGLLQIWNGDLIWCNPDYTQALLLAFARKAIEEYEAGRTRCVLLLYPADLRTRHARKLLAAGAVRFLFDDRIEFGGRKQAGALRPRGHRARTDSFGATGAGARTTLRIGAVNRTDLALSHRQ